MRIWLGSGGWSHFIISLTPLLMQELEKQHRGVFVDGSMVDEMRYVINDE